MDQIRGESYAIFLYKNNSMTWSKHHLNAIGISAPATNFFYTYNSPYSTKPTAFDLDKIIGNAGSQRKWIRNFKAIVLKVFFELFSFSKKTFDEYLRSVRSL